ncbi:MAG: succinate dehydrogenase cytochrome b558 subunit [Planctomycetales bacterium]|nr:succinate dehydrogenase cytochrome b558 subunit [Planctomycetales bacterium]
MENKTADTKAAEHQPSFLVRHEFLIRRLHSLSGLIPVGAYMCVHLLVNASVLDSPGAFQRNVYQIHSLGNLLPLVEWVFIFIPILFHAIFGIVIIQGGLPNTSSYPRVANYRYTLQRVTGVIAFFFIMWHVFHMHGWFHGEAWLERIHPLMGGMFKPFNAASSAGAAIHGHPLIQVVYAVGILSCVFHLANGIWTMGITWGVWISPGSQRRASYACLAFGLVLAAVGMGALSGFGTMDEEKVQEAVELENRLYNSRVSAGEIDPNEEKRSPSGESASSPAVEARAPRTELDSASR